MLRSATSFAWERPFQDDPVGAYALGWAKHRQSMVDVTVYSACCAAMAASFCREIYRASGNPVSQAQVVLLQQYTCMTSLVPKRPPCVRPRFGVGSALTLPTFHPVHSTQRQDKCLLRTFAEWPAYQNTLWQVSKDMAGNSTTTLDPAF